MRVAVVHSFYRSDVPSGENSIVLRQCEDLRLAGHTVNLFARHSDESMQSTFAKLCAGVTVTTGRGPSPMTEIADFDPDIIHVHNLFPNFGSSWKRDISTPIVTTLHNFRSICANGLLFRDGKSCTACPSGDNKAAIRHACYRDSRIATLPLYLQQLKPFTSRGALNDSKALVALSQSAKERFIEFGYPQPDQIHVIPNAAPSDASRRSELVGSRWFAAGRFSPEKGLARLVEDWPDSESLAIMGDGPSLDHCRRLGKPNIALLGQKDHSEVMRMLSGSVGVVVPSECFEMQPTIAIEALSSGVPLVARRGNAAADLVQEFQCGLVYSSKEELAGALRAVATNRERFSAAAVEAFERNFETEQWVRSITRLYKSLL